MNNRLNATKHAGAEYADVYELGPVDFEIPTEWTSPEAVDKGEASEFCPLCQGGKRAARTPATGAVANGLKGRF